ncbi:b-cell receptor CD22 [Trichonephila clavipes]|nr:b-cell receptor CD22 [Trichonephila clavipes]
MLSDRGPRNSWQQRAKCTPVVSRCFEQHTGDSTSWLGSTPILKGNLLEVDKGLPPLFPFHQPHERTCGSTANKPECTVSETTNDAGASILMCKADGFPTKINFTWSKDNETLDDDFDMDSDNDDYSVYILPDTAERYGLYVCIAINDVGVSEPCERTVSGPGLAGWHAEFGDKNVLVIAAIIGSIAILFVLAIIIIILIMRKRRLRNGDRFNSCQVIYSQFGLAIHQNDHEARRRFVEWAQNEIAVVPDFHKRILFSDEAHFWLNGYVNKQNCRIWSEVNPQVYVETPLHPEKLTVWCALWAGGILLQKR